MGHLGRERIALDPGVQIARRRPSRFSVVPRQIATVTFVVSGPRPSWQ
jgi:hypothetical protein